jgi:lysophospholipase L1-like esterase
MPRRFLIASSLALNAVVLGAAVWLALGGATSLIVRRFIAPKHEQLRTHFDATPVEAGDVVFLGDSITEGGRWEKLFPGVRTRNRGIGGDTTTGVLARVDQVAGRRAAGVFLLIGTNDLFGGTSEAEIAERVAQIVARLRAGSPTTRVFVQSVLPRAAEYRGRIEALNARLATVARDSGAEFVDLYPAFLDSGDGSLRDDLSNDQLHLLGSGYVLWRDRIAAHVASLTTRSARP